MSFQSPIAIPGVNNVDFLRLACNARRKAKGEAELDPLEFYAYLTPKVLPLETLFETLSFSYAVQLESLKMDPSFLNRNVNEGFSGGERKRNEILQLAVLEVRALSSYPIEVQVHPCSLRVTWPFWTKSILVSILMH